MSAEMYFIALVIVLGALYFLVPATVGAYLRFRGTRVITCPETKKPAAVEVDAGHAALTALLGKPDLRLKDCSRWPERRDCGQDCLWQIELAPEECLARTMLTRWYEGRTCAFCGKPFGEIHWSDHKPALFSPERKTIEWSEVHLENLPDVLSTHEPVCWNCHIAESFCRQHPELVVERSWDRNARIAKN